MIKVKKLVESEFEIEARVGIIITEHSNGTGCRRLVLEDFGEVLRSSSGGFVTSGCQSRFSTVCLTTGQLQYSWMNNLESLINEYKGWYIDGCQIQG